MNPYTIERTPHQQRLIANGRTELLTRWNDKRFAPSKTSLYTKELATLPGQTEKYELRDVFRIANTPPSFPDEWAAERTRSGFAFEQYADHIDIIVPQSYYLARQRCCMSVDAGCVLNTLVYILAILGFLYLGSRIN
jgi:hypothetical protein